MTQKQLKQFVRFWNTANGFKNGEVDEPNMRIGKNKNKVYFNIYDTPDLDIEQIVSIYNLIK